MAMNLVSHGTRLIDKKNCVFLAHDISWILFMEIIILFIYNLIFFNHVIDITAFLLKYLVSFLILPVWINHSANIDSLPCE